MLNKRPFFHLSLTCLFLSGWLMPMIAVEPKPTPKPLPNIVVILVDDMGYGDPKCFNPQSQIETPSIDALARDGMRFTDAHAPGPLCHMSRYGLMTGIYPFRIDVTKWPTQPLIKPQQLTIASVAKASGYHTAMVGKWHVGFKEVGYDQPLTGGPIDCGFESFYGMRASTDIPPYFYIRQDRAEAPPTAHIDEEFSGNWGVIQGRRRLAGGIAPNLHLDDVLPRFTNEAISVIEGHQRNRDKNNQPLFLYLAYPAPHTPWLPSPEFMGKSKVSLYGDFVMMVDAEIGRVTAALKAAKMSDDTLVIFTSDNGPCWFDVDREKWGHDSAGGFRGMKADAWEAGHRMPFIVRWPGRVTAGSTSDKLICFTDLLATFAALMGQTIPQSAALDSYNILPYFTQTGSDQPPEQKNIRPSFVMQAGSSSSMKTIRLGTWKLITGGLGSGGFSKPKEVTPGPGEPAGQLYHLAIDPAEKNNLYAKHPEIVSELTAELERIVHQPQ